jgi:hypothetical protein
MRLFAIIMSVFSLALLLFSLVYLENLDSMISLCGHTTEPKDASEHFVF